MYEQL